MATIEDVYSLLAENGAVVKFTSDTQLAPLRSMLSEILGKANTSLVEGNKKSNKLLSDTGKSRDKLLKSMNKGIDQVEKAVKEQKGGMLGFLKSGNLWMNAGKMLLGAASMLIDYGKQYYGNLKKLSDAGVRIAEGFDRAYGLYAGIADMSHENFAKLLIQNKKFIARMNSASDSVSSGAQLIAEMASKLNGKYALDEEQTGTILEFFTNITNTMSRRKLTDSYLINQAELLGTTMKGLSAAVGMSIEQFKEKVKQDEQDLAERKIMRDPRSRGRYMLNKAAMGKDAALFLETGVPNEKVLQMMANTNQQAFLQKMLVANKKVNSEDKETYKKQLHQYAVEYKNSMTKFIDPVRENFDNQNALFLSLAGDWAKGQFGGMDFENISPEMLAKALDDSDMENQTVNGLNMLNRTVDVIKDLLIYKVFKDSGKSVAEAFKVINKGGDALKKFILGKDYDKIKDSMEGSKAGIDTDKSIRYENKINKNTRHKDIDTIVEEQVEDSKKYLNYVLKNNKGLKEYNEYAARNGLLQAVELNGKVRLFDRTWYGRQSQAQKELRAWENFGKEKRTRENGTGYYYDELSGKVYTERDYQNRLDYLKARVNSDNRNYYQNKITALEQQVMDDTNKIYEEKKRLEVELSEKDRQLLESISESSKESATNTGNQAQAAKDAVEHAKSVESEGTRINAISPAMIPTIP